MDLAGVLWVGAADTAVAEALAERFGIPLHRAAGAGTMQGFRALLAELQELDAERLLVAGPFPPTAVAAVLRTPGQAVVVAGDAAAERDARVLRLPVVADADDAAAALGL